MAEKMEQKIVVLTQLNSSDKQLIRQGAKIAAIFKKELCLVHNARKLNPAQKTSAKEQLESLAQNIENELQTPLISTLLLNECARHLADVLAEVHEVSLIVANALHFRKHRKALSESPVPWLFVHPESEISGYDHLVQPLDQRKENSDCSLWCSYFGRFNQAEVVVVAAADRSKEGKSKVATNVKHSAKLYKKFGIDHKMYKGSKSSFKVVFEALELALASNCNLFVMLGSSGITPLDYLIGLPEHKIFKTAGKLPVLLINPRRDNYILCD